MGLNASVMRQRDSHLGSPFVETPSGKPVWYARLIVQPILIWFKLLF